MSRREDPVEDEVGACACGVAQNPADGLADEEFLLLEHRLGETGEPVEVAAALSQRNQVRQQGRTADPEVLLARPALENGIESSIPFAQRPDEIPGQGVDKGSGLRFAQQVFNEIRIPGAEAVLRLDEHHRGCSATFVDGCVVPG